MVWGVVLPFCKAFKAGLFGVIWGVVLVTAWLDR